MVMKLAFYSLLTFMVFSLYGARAFCAPAELSEKPAGEQLAADYKTCVFESHDVGKLKFRGATREEAFEKTSRACLQARVEGYIKIRGDVPTVERKILFAEDCVNQTFCKH